MWHNVLVLVIELHSIQDYEVSDDILMLIIN